MGVLLALIGALAFSLMNVFVRMGVRRGGNDNGVLTTIAVNVLVLTPIVVVLALTDRLPPWSTEGVIWFVLAGIGSTFLGRFTLFGGIRHLGAARATAIKNATPLVTVAIALGALGESLTPLAAAGVGLIMLGLILLVRESFRRAGPIAEASPRTDPVEIALESEALAEGGIVGRTRATAGRAVASMTGNVQRHILLGISMAALAAICFGTAHAFRKLGVDELPDPFLGAAIGSWSAFVALLASVAVAGELRPALARSIGTVRIYYWLAGLAGVIGQISFFSALHFAPVSHVAVVASAETILTVLLAALIIRKAEVLTMPVVLSAFLVFGGAGVIAAAR